MKSAYIYITSIIVFGLISVPAQTNKNSSGSGNKVSTDIIFDDIMQSLPADVKSKLDSVSTVNIKKSTMSQKKDLDVDKTSKGQLDYLSDDMKIRVEKAMQEIDSQKQKRQLQFKESKKKN